jgi:hypothetical protein
MDKHHIDSIFNDMINDITYIKMESLFKKFRKEKKLR